MTFSVFGFDIPVAVLALGSITGVTYGVLAVGLVLVYRSSKVINFAHGEIGAFGAAVLGIAVVQWHLPYWTAFVFGVESPRESWRLHRLRGWSNATTEQVPAGGA